MSISIRLYGVTSEEVQTIMNYIGSMVSSIDHRRIKLTVCKLIDFRDLSYGQWPKYDFFSCTHSFLTVDTHLSGDFFCFNLSFSLSLFDLFQLSHIFMTNTSLFSFQPFIFPSDESVPLWNGLIWRCHYQDGLQADKIRLYIKQRANYNECTFQLSKHVQLAILSLKNTLVNEM
jgi:hypothetical protein